MSRRFQLRFGNANISKARVREFLRPKVKVDQDGNRVVLTEQGHEKECDINRIVAQYEKTGLLTHVQKIEAKFGDWSGVDFKTMSDKVAGARSMFEGLPNKIRKRFDHSPEAFLAFMDNPANREEAIELGLIDEKTPEDQDGLGEHITKPKTPEEIAPEEEVTESVT